GTVLEGACPIGGARSGRAGGTLAVGAGGRPRPRMRTTSARRTREAGAESRGWAPPERGSGARALGVGGRGARCGDRAGDPIPCRHALFALASLRVAPRSFDRRRA